MFLRVWNCERIVRPLVDGRPAKGGEYFAAGVGGAVTGRGADLLIIDDPHSVSRML